MWSTFRYVIRMNERTNKFKMQNQIEKNIYWERERETDFWASMLLLLLLLPWMRVFLLNIRNFEHRASGGMYTNGP